MATVLATGEAPPPERAPGDFRRSTTGTPYVSDPSGATVRSGPRKGEPKLLAYGRPSSFGKQIESTYNLQKWSERQVVLGLQLDPTLLAGPDLVERDRDTAEWRADADAVVAAARDAARASLAAERGTHAHDLAELDDEGHDWITRAEHGENLGIPHDAQQSLVDAWRTMLARESLEVLASEAAVVHDGYRMAGRLDRIARLAKPLRFALLSGEVVEIAAGTVLVLDIKSGKRRLDNRGTVMYWQSYAIQIATYAGAVPYDVDTDARGAWGWPVDQRWGLIAHLDVLGAIEGRPSCELLAVDLEAGRHAAELCLAAKAWEKRADVFSVAQITAPGPTVPVERPAAQDASAPCAAEPVQQPTRGDAGPAAGAPPSDPAATATATAPHAVTASNGDWPPFDEPPPVEASPWRSTGAASIAPPLPPAVPDAAPAPQPPERRLPRRALDEGGPVNHMEFKALEARYLPLGQDVKDWFQTLVTEANRAGVDFRAKPTRTVRRFELYRGLIALMVGGDHDDELIRVITATVLDTDAALHPVNPLGYVVGALDADEATRFAQACDDFAADRLAIVVDPDGTLRLRPLAGVA